MVFSTSLISEFSSRNAGTITDFSVGSKKKVWWVCEKDHEWEARIDHRVKGVGCPYCSGRKPVVGETDLFTTHPDLIKEWHQTLNTVVASDVSSGSSRKVWWKCELGHEWEAAVKNRARRGDGCPYCNKGKTWVGFNDLKTVDFSLYDSWDENKNSISWNKVNPNSKSSYWWVCELGHSWLAPVYNRYKLKTGCPYCSGRQAVSGVTDIRTTHPHLVGEWDMEKNGSVNLDNVTFGSNVPVWWVCELGHSYLCSPYNKIQRNFTCQVCSPHVSVAEKNIADFLKETLNLKICTSTRHIIPPKELDIYVPEKNIAIEFNGLYWHSEAAGKGKNYHYDKWLACKNKGIQLIQIWEDDWNRNPKLVKRMLAHKLGVSQEPKIYARNTTVVEISFSMAKKFLDKYHIQQSVTGSKYVGLKQDSTGDLVAVMVVTYSGTDLLISRFATSCFIVGGFSKLLAYIKNFNVNHKRIVSFSDNMVSDGGLYEKNGFEIDKVLQPDYMYVVNGVRKHKFGYRLKKFQQDSTLLFQEGASESELATLNNFIRVWDAGKTKWVL